MTRRLQADKVSVMALPPPSPSTTALITGASSGIGEEFARQLAAKGYGLFLVARREDRLRALAADIERDYGVRVEVAACDLADEAERRTLPERVAAAGLDVAILVNNAGFTTVGDVHANPDRQLGMIRVNVEALVDLTTMWLPAMTERGSGAVVNVASSVAFQPMPVQATYAATKAFVLSFTEGVWSELRGTGVSITALCPGPVSTEFLEAGEFKREHPGPSFVWSTAADVAKAGIEGAERGKRVVIPGVVNRVTTTFGRHGPRSVVLGPVASAYRRTIGE
jgi:short-subunit dehydrogenase